MSPKLLTFLAAASAVFVASASVLAAPGRASKPVKSTPAHPRVAPAAPSENGSFGVTLSMAENTYAVPAALSAPSPHGPMIHASLTFFNHSRNPLRLYIGGAPTLWQILDAQGKTVWDYSVGRVIPHFIRVVNLQNGQLCYTQDIPLQTQGGTPLAPGRYTLRGAIPGAFGATASLDFTVTR